MSVLLNSADPPDGSAFIPNFDSASFSDADLTESLVRIRREHDRLAAQETQLLAAWDRRKAWAADGSKAPANRWSRETSMSVDTGRAVIRRARRLEHMPAVMAAFVGGQLSTDRVDLLIDHCPPELQKSFLEAEDVLLQIVSNSTFHIAKRALAQWASAARDALGLSKDRNEQRGLSVAVTLDDCVDIKALLGPIDGELFTNELSRLERKLFKADWKEAQERLGKQDVTRDDLVRSNRQRRADALIEMARRSAGADNPTRPRETISVVVGEERFNQILETAGGKQLSNAELLPLLCRAHIRRIVFGPKNRLLEFLEQRFFPELLKTAMRIRDQFCQDPSVCDAPAWDCEADHYDPHGRGGKTTYENGKCMCPFHNRRKGMQLPFPEADE